MAFDVLVITGPTATGKSALAAELSKRLGGEVVSADSMQVYRGLDIGTAKVSPEETGTVPHHMLDVADPAESFSVARYVALAAACCEDIIARGRLPVIAGGTGLYIDSLISGRDFAGGNSDGELRGKIAAEYDRLGGEAMLERLRLIDPERARLLAAGDKRRIVRALEIFEQTGETVTAHDKRTREQPPRYRAAYVALDFENRADLYSRIDARVDEMVRRGLFEEVEGLSEFLSPECTAMQAIGYKEAAAALRGEISREEAIEQIKQASRRYAKRQLTWLRRNEEIFRIRWGAEVDISYAADEVEKFLKGKS